VPIHCAEGSSFKPVIQAGFGVTMNAAGPFWAFVKSAEVSAFWKSESAGPWRKATALSVPPTVPFPLRTVLVVWAPTREAVNKKVESSGDCISR
jgi:hypothetical protein